MLDKIAFSLYSGYFKAKLKVKKILEAEDGSVVETVIMIAVAVILAGALINLLTNEGFTIENDEDVGLIEYLFYKIKKSMDTKIFT